MKLKLSATVIMLFVALSLIFGYNKEKQTKIVLKAYNNTVALYENGIQKKIYDSIVLNTLPVNDISALKKGIEVENEDELLRLIEDFDG